MGSKKGLGTLQDLEVPFFPCDTMEELLDVARELRRDREKCSYKGEYFDHVFLDSASVAGELGLEGAKKTFGFGEFMWDSVKGSGKDPRKAYPYMNEKVRQLMKILFDIKAHFIAISREAVVEIEDEQGNKTMWSVPEFPGTKLPNELPGWPDAVLRGEFVNGRRLFRTKSLARKVAGIRVPDNVPGSTSIATAIPDFIIPNTTLICRWMQTWDPALLKQLTPVKEEKPKAAPVASPVGR